MSKSEAFLHYRVIFGKIIGAIMPLKKLNPFKKVHLHSLRRPISPCRKFPWTKTELGFLSRPKHSSCKSNKMSLAGFPSSKPHPLERDISEASRGSVDSDGFATVHAKALDRDSSLHGVDKNFQPSLTRAREHFMQSLPRRVRDPLQPSGFRLCLPGELRGADGEPAQLYNPLCASTPEIGEFGIGVSLYFGSLKYMFAVLLVCALCQLGSINANKQYNPPGTPASLLGSALGANVFSLEASKQGMADMLSTAVLLLAALLATCLQGRLVQQLDKEHLTPSDYSVRVDNPPRNVSNPDEYYRFFSKFGDVVLVTIAYNNGQLVESMAAKKLYHSMVNSQQRYKDIAHELHKGYKDQDDVGCFETNMQLCGYSPTLGYAQGLLSAETKVLNSLSQKDYRPWRVFVTYAKQAQQRACLQACKVSYFQVMSGSAPGSEANFDGCLLNIDRAPEPNDLMYQNSCYSATNRFCRLMLSYAACGILLALSFVVVNALSKQGSSVVAAFISVLNVLLPRIIKLITYLVEKHVHKSDEQMSTLLKLAVVRCINSGLLIYLTADHETRFDEQHLSHVQSVLIADAVTTPLVRLLDISGYLNRNYFSKGVATQDELNVLFMPGDWTLAERYTDTLKTLFVGMLFAVPVPTGLFITAVSMLTTFFVDKYSLTRQWKRPPNLDESLSTAARYLLLIIVFVHVNISKDYFANWPYNASLPAECNFLRCEPNAATMTPTQISLVETYNAINIFLFSFVVLWFVVVNFGGWILSLASGHASGLDDGRDLNAFDPSFRELTAQSAYIPVLEPVGLPDPVIMADIAALPEKYLPLFRSRLFNDRRFNPSDFSVVKTSEFPLIDDQKMLESLFSRIKFYEPKGLGAAFTNYSAQATSNVVHAVQNSGLQQPAAQPVAQPAATATPGAQARALPAGWVEKLDKNTGKTYYSNSALKTTSWERPR